MCDLAEPATVAERSHPSARRPRATRTGRASASSPIVGSCSPRSRRRAGKLAEAYPSPGQCARRLIDQLDPRDRRARSHLQTRARPSAARPRAVTALPTGSPRTSPTSASKTTTDDFVSGRDRAARRRGHVHHQQLRRAERARQPRAPVAAGSAQAVVVISKNANVATGPDGAGRRSRGRRPASRRARVRRDRRPDRLDGRDRPALPDGPGAGRDRGDSVASPDGTRSTTRLPRHHDDRHGPEDRGAPSASAPRRVVGIAKGVGMIEPNMATMITIVLTDAEVSADDARPDLSGG